MDYLLCQRAVKHAVPDAPTEGCTAKRVERKKRHGYKSSLRLGRKLFPLSSRLVNRTGGDIEAEYVFQPVGARESGSLACYLVRN